MRPTRTTSATCRPSARGSVTRCTTRGSRSTRRCSTPSTSTTAMPAGPSGRRSVTDARFAIAVGRFYEDLAARLVSGAETAFSEGRVSSEVFDVPGAYELPLAALYLAQTGRFAGVACLGAVIRGETDHYDYVCAEAARGIQDVQ